ncbi:hypothetical protein ACN38_g9113 [Penicillium nordicum]|uniref:Uncharacterized protein n=1 Tax=Penicillium nordicum TaxID=229535 RepID=A0A0M9WCV0_9EURO|nr:hypothetical protein ACN38_g9113 [Penicillium nordicum]
MDRSQANPPCGFSKILFFYDKHAKHMLRYPPFSTNSDNNRSSQYDFPCHGRTGHPSVHELTSYNTLSKKSFLHNGERSLNLCADNLKRWRINARAEAHRAATVAKHHKRGIIARDTDKVVNTSHRSSLNVTPNTSESELFSKCPV